MIEVIAQVAENATQMTWVTSQTFESTMQIMLTVSGIFFAFFLFMLVRLFEIHGKVAEIDGRMNSYVMKKSPLSLTEKGVNLLNASGAKECIEKNKEVLLEQFEGVNAPFDIQEKAEKLMQEKLREDDKVKDYAFRNGERMEDIANVSGIVLRDIVFKEKNIKIEEEEAQVKKK